MKQWFVSFGDPHRALRILYSCGACIRGALFAPCRSSGVVTIRRLLLLEVSGNLLQITGVKMLLLDKLAENIIAEAVERGELSGLAGEGQPLQLDDDNAIPADLRAGLRILKNSGFLPKEIAQRGEIRQLESLVLQTECMDAKTRLLTKISLLKSQMAGR